MNVGQQENKWYVFYCKSRSEKKVYEELVAREFSVFLPLVKVERVWSDRIKKVILPMFSGYIFVKCAKFEVSKIVMLPQIVAPLKTGKEMSVISEKEIELLRIIEQSGLFVSTEVTSIQAGDKVEIIVGPLRGYKGLCIEDRSQNHVLIAIEGINQTLKLKISKDGVKKL